MNVPGSNLLSIALRVIRPQTLGHRAFVSRSVNAAGDWVSVFATSVDITGSMQTVNLKLKQQLGLNLTKNYQTLYTQAVVNAVTRDREGDLLTYGGKTWQAESDMNWTPQDGWRKVLCVEVPAYA